MKNLAATIYRFTIAFISIVNYTNAQSAIGLLRYNDNFTFIKDDSLKKGFTRLKYIELSEIISFHLAEKSENNSNCTITLISEICLRNFQALMPTSLIIV